ncbi:ElyC/SanA/YdcF family protein [Pseudoclavibacter terrae]|uniref:ElyC/SanA/YdcF family protein n=1 Tax=Pseudoclavibacter terrae TaxID=1530195 RepID=UPI00142F12EE|nr:ElyC/SanA/YdcF family protein [Pseudoclavibacter terrae]
MALTPVGPIFAPTPGEAGRADVILVLGPATASRLDLAKEMMESGHAANLVVSTNSGHERFGARNLQTCRVDQGYPVHCEQSAPFTTQGEVGLLQRLSEENGWHKAIVITSKTHATRASLYIGRCYDREADVIWPSERLSVLRGVEEYFYQSAAFVKAFAVTNDCV